MKIIAIKNIENCIAGNDTKEVIFDAPVTRDFIHYLGKNSDLQYFPNFPRPFFKIEVQGKYLLKGIESERIIKIILKEPFETSLQTLIEKVEGY
jgi:hypothetical protein